MTAFFDIALVILVATLAASFWRALVGPTGADRLMSIQLVATSGIAAVVLIAAGAQEHAMIDVALILALLAAFAAVAFVKSATPDGAGDPEEEDR